MRVIRGRGGPSREGKEGVDEELKAALLQKKRKKGTAVKHYAVQGRASAGQKMPPSFGEGKKGKGEETCHERKPGKKALQAQAFPYQRKGKGSGKKNARWEKRRAYPILWKRREGPPPPKENAGFKR